MDIKIHKIVPKLNGVQNWDTWIEKFEIALRQKKNDYWEIFIGNATLPNEPQFYPVNEESIRAIFRQQNQAQPEPIPTAADLAIIKNNLQQRNTVLRNDYITAVTNFTQWNLDIVLLVGTVLEDSVQSRTHGVRDAYQIYEILKRNYGTLTLNSVWMLWQKARVTTLRESNDHTQFMQEFRDIITQLRNIVNINN
jgi:hypothetical protein